MLIGPGEGGDSTMLPHLLAALKIHRPRATPDALLGDKAYSFGVPGPCCAHAGSEP